MGRQTKDQLLYDVHNNCINLSTREIYLHSYYSKDDDGEPGVDYRQATTFIKNFHMLDVSPYRPMLIHMHTTGGSWDNGMAIYNTIRQSRCNVTILAYSQAVSMSGIIFQAGDIRVMMPDCYLMIHHGYSSIGDVHPFAMENFSKFSMKVCKRMIEIFATRAVHSGCEFFSRKGKDSLEYAKKFFDKKIKQEVDWYLSPEEAVFYGLADGVLGDSNYPDVASLRYKE